MNCSVLSLLANPSVGTYYQLQEYSRRLGSCNLRILWFNQEYSFGVTYSIQLQSFADHRGGPVKMTNEIDTIPPIEVLHA